VSRIVDMLGMTWRKTGQRSKTRYHLVGTDVRAVVYFEIPMTKHSSGDGSGAGWSVSLNGVVVAQFLPTRLVAMRRVASITKMRRADVLDGAS
jgi:hypothetical protein